MRIRRWMPKQTHVRIFLSLALALSIIIVPYTFFLSMQFSKYADAEIHTITKDKLNQTLNNMTFTLNKLRSYGLSIFNDQNVHQWLVSESSDSLLSMKALNAITNWLANEPFIYNAYLINPVTREVIDSHQGIRSFDTFEDQSILETLNNNRPRQLRYFTHTVGQHDYLALVIPSAPNVNQDNGQLVLLLDNQLLQEYLLPPNKAAGIHVLILDEQDRIVLGPKQEYARFSPLLPNINESEGYFNIEIDHEPWSVQYGEMQPETWTIFYLTKLGQLNNKVSTFQSKILISSLSMLAILLILVFWSSHRSYRPFSQLAEMIRKKTSGSETKTEFPVYPDHKIIKQGMEIIFQNMDRIEFSLRNHQEWITGEYLKQWILLGRMNDSVLNYVRNELNLLNYPELVLSVIRIEPYSLFTEKYHHFSSRKLLKYAIGNIAKEIVQRSGGTAENVDFGGDHIVLLIGAGEGEGESAGRPVREMLLEVSAEIEKWMNIQSVVGLSRSFAPNEDIRALYDHAYEMTQLKFISGAGKLFDDTDYSDYLTMIKPLKDETILDQLIQAIRIGQAEKAHTLTDQLMEQMRNLSYADCKFQLTLIIHSLAKAFKPVSFLQPKEGIQTFLERFNTLKDVQNWLHDGLEEAVAQMRQRKNISRKEDISLELTEYVKSRIHDPMLTIEEIAGHLSLSASYVRQVFKDVYGVTLADYILEERIHRVKSLLETTDWPIADISTSSGFQTKSHFYTAFKKATGMTPNAYRHKVKLKEFDA